MIYHVFSAEKADDSYEIGGAEGIYTHPEPNKEHLIIYGPITEDITLYVSIGGGPTYHLSSLHFLSNDVK